ncbi:MAG: ribosome maturation factor RimP [Firmicutes bacterium]|nr:ribosome maturation factor RimP [Bacillota bacterium]
MKRKEIEKITEDITTPILDDFNFELVDVEFVKEGPHRYLRLYIDKPGGINIDDCQRVSEKVSEKLDEIDPIEENFFLEVSSPGIDRPLKSKEDLDNAIDEEVEVNLYKALKGNKRIDGKLVSYDDEKFIIENIALGQVEIDREIVSKINLAVKF